MDVIPAVDLKDGRCVRLLKGRKDRETQYSDDPVQMARHWEDQGASRLHLVDLDGAFGEEGGNRDIVAEILDTLSIPCQVGGGLRDTASVVQLLDLGADAVIIGTAGIRDPDWLGALVDRVGSRQVYAGVDTRGEQVLIKGWEEDSKLPRSQWLRTLEELGINRIVYTDVRRDGTQEGPDVEGTRQILEQTSLEVIASGGVGSLEHLRRLASLRHPRLQGVIVGRALYERTFTLSQALRATSDP